MNRIICYHEFMSDEIEELQEILRNDPYNFQARRTLSIVLLDNGFNKEAKQHLLYLVRTFPENAELLYNLGIAYEKLGEFEKAERAYLRAIVISPETDFYYNLGLTYIEMEEYGKAIVALKHVVEIDTDDANTFFNIGLCFFRKEEYEVALDYFQKAAELNHEDIFAHFYIANIYDILGQKDMSLQEYQTILSIAPDYSWAYYNMGSIAYSEGNTEAALQYLMKTLMYNHHDIKAIILMVQIYISQLRYTEAMDTIMPSLEANPQNGDLLYTLSQIYKLKEDDENYERTLASAITNHQTLTFPLEKVQAEYSKIKAKIDEVRTERAVEEQRLEQERILAEQQAMAEQQENQEIAEDENFDEEQSFEENSVDDMENSEEQQEYDDVEESIDDDDE